MELKLNVMKRVCGQIQASNRESMYQYNLFNGKFRQRNKTGNPIDVVKTGNGQETYKQCKQLRQNSGNEKLAECKKQGIKH